ncbi:MAG: hypothetical protein K6E51_10720 [Treponema sp.]|nr:hypothetical protein [Treponema sp.]
MKCISRCAALLLVVMASVSVVYASDDKKSSTTDLQTVKEEGKQLIKNIGTAAKKIGTTVGETVNKGVKEIQGTFLNNLVGVWQFENGNALTIITINEDGSMRIEQTKKKKTEYVCEGTCVVTANKITFTPTPAKDKKSKKDWEIAYQLQNHKSEMQLTSDAIPKDENGYKFTNPTVFIKKK